MSELSRRSFLGGVVGSTAALVVGPWASEGVRALSAQPQAHILGRQTLLDPKPFGRLIAQCSDDVFARLCAAVAGKSLRVVHVDRVGCYQDGHEMRSQAHTGAYIDGCYHSGNIPVFPIEAFRRKTSHWQREGLAMQMGAPAMEWETDGEPAEQVFREARAVGLLVLPAGVTSAHYVDEATGMVMRVVVSYDMMRDGWWLRYDVLFG